MATGTSGSVEGLTNVFITHILKKFKIDNTPSGQ